MKEESGGKMLMHYAVNGGQPINITSTLPGALFEDR